MIIMTDEEFEQLKKNAARYEWLRKQRSTAYVAIMVNQDTRDTMDNLSDYDLDHAIDDLMLYN